MSLSLYSCRLLDCENLNDFQQLQCYCVSDNTLTLEIKILTLELACRTNHKETRKVKQICIFCKETGACIFFPYNKFLLHQSWLIVEKDRFYLLRLSVTHRSLFVVNPLCQCQSIEKAIDFFIKKLNTTYAITPYSELHTEISMEICSIYEGLPKNIPHHRIELLPHTYSLTQPWRSMTNPPEWTAESELAVVIIKKLKKLKNHWYLLIYSPAVKRMLILDEYLTFIKGGQVKKHSLNKHLNEIEKLTKQINILDINQKIYRQILIERAINYFCLRYLDEAIADLTIAINIKESSWIYNMRGFLYHMAMDRASSFKDFEKAKNIKNEHSDYLY